MQIADGCLTYIGVKELGVALEANPMIRAGFNLFGVGATIFWVKAIALMIPLALPTDAKPLWTALWFVNLLYLLVAVVPWLWVLFMN